MPHYPITFTELATHLGITVRSVERLVDDGMPALNRGHDKEEGLVDVEAVREWLSYSYPNRRKKLDIAMPPQAIDRLPQASTGLTIAELISSNKIEELEVDPNSQTDLSNAISLHQRWTKARKEKIMLEKEKGDLVDKYQVKELLFEIMASLNDHFGEAFLRRLEDMGCSYKDAKTLTQRAMEALRDDIAGNAERRFPTE